MNENAVLHHLYMNTQNHITVPSSLGLSVREGKVVVSSRDVAEKFGKRHDNVLRDIENLECSPEFGRLNFEESSYINKQNKLQPEVLMTRDGFTFLAMGFTGAKAAQFKEAYIAEFNRMEAELKNQDRGESLMKVLSDPHAVLKIVGALADERDKTKALEAKIEEDSHHVLFSKVSQASKDCISVNQLAKDINKMGYPMGEKRLFEWSRENGWLIKRSGSTHNLPTQKSVESKLFEINSTPKYQNGEERVYSTPKVTQKGKDFFLSVFEKMKRQEFGEELPLA